MSRLIAFRSRSEAMRLSRALSARRIANTVINTPRSLGVSCGLSVVFSPSSTDTVRNIVTELNLQTQQGIFQK
ncbi:MAG: DUF3343 domain-containing protein [Clostridia bacterium]|nr:DUF3343 domain-containing protein [Clostridia bacterium]